MKPTGLVILSPPLAEPGYKPSRYARTLYAYQRKLSVIVSHDCAWRRVTPAVQYRHYIIPLLRVLTLLHEDLKPKTVQAGRRISCEEITGVDCQGRLVSQASWCTNGTQRAHGCSLGTCTVFTGLFFVFQLSVFGKMLYWLLPPPYNSSRASCCFPLLPIAFCSFSLLPVASFCFPLLPILSHCFPLLPIASHCFLLFSIASYCFPLFSVASCCFPLLPIASHCFLLLPVASCCFPCLSTLHNFWSLDSIGK